MDLQSSTRQDLALLLDGWRDGGAGPLPRRLAHALRSRIASGLLPSGASLPPERSLASVLGVSRSTVVGALDELRAGGFVVSRQGSGTRVVAGEPDAGVPAVARRLLHAGPTLNLAASVPSDASHLPPVGLDVAELAAAAPGHGYGPAGLTSLRELIAARHGELGVPTAVEQVHVTNGAQHALDLALGALARAGDAVAIEDPTYVGVFDLLAARRLRPLVLPLDVVWEASSEFVRLCRGGRAKAVLLVPAVHSPTGRVRRANDVQRLAHCLDQIGLPVIEDNTVADLAFGAPRPLSLAQVCRRAPVLSAESTSKVCWGGLRVGWLRGDRDVIERTIDDRGRVDFGTSVPSQLLAEQLLRQYGSIVASRRLELAGRARLFRGLLCEQLPEWRFETPRGGLSAWVDTGVDAEVVTEHALRHGVTVAPGSSASPSRASRTYLRLCFDRPAVELEAAVERLRRAWEDGRGRRQTARSRPSGGAR